jgi:peptide methionine sulfoxide reductase MsrA
VTREEARLGRSIATSLEPLRTFYPAEEYHEDYLAKRGQTAAKGSTAPIRCYG